MLERPIQEGIQVRVVTEDHYDGKYGWIDDPKHEEDEEMVLVELQSGKKDAFLPRELEKANF